MKYEVVWKPRQGGKTTFRQTVREMRAYVEKIKNF